MEGQLSLSDSVSSSELTSFPENFNGNKFINMTEVFIELRLAIEYALAAGIHHEVVMEVGVKADPTKEFLCLLVESDFFIMLFCNESLRCTLSIKYFKVVVVSLHPADSPVYPIANQF